MRTSFHAIPSRGLRLLVLCTAASGVLYGASCSSTDSGGEEVNPEYADVIYEGETNDEALEVLYAAKASDDEAKAPVFDSPMESAMVEGATPLKFSWHGGGTASLRSAPSLKFASVEAPSVMSPLVELFGRERAAHAHLAPFNGTGYLLVFASGSDAKLVRVFTAKTTYTPTADIWSKIKGAGSVKLSIIEGIFTENNLDTDGGPWNGKTVNFTVK